MESGGEDRHRNAILRRWSSRPSPKAWWRPARRRGLLDIAVHNLRDFTTDKHHVVDDVPFGGGRNSEPEPFFAALASASGAGRLMRWR